jgi:hypothetical protein
LANKKFLTPAFWSLTIGNPMCIYRLRALASGAKNFIGKPFDPVQAMTRIHDMQV